MKRECNRKQHDKTRQTEATTIQRLSESNFVEFNLSFPFSLLVLFRSSRYTQRTRKLYFLLCFVVSRCNPIAIFSTAFCYATPVTLIITTFQQKTPLEGT